jgi:leucine dehydrogenase
MFDASKVTKMSVPGWEAAYRAEIAPGVVSIIAIHDTSRGWALGGCRMSKYKNESEALTDVLRLSRGMTFKNAIADLPLGGGKSLIVCDPSVSGKERENILENFGRFVAWTNRESDRYCTAEDMNTTVSDMNIVNRHTNNIHGTTVDPSPYTAWGVFSGIEYAVHYFAMDLFNGERGLEGKRVLVQGLGKVGKTLLEYLHDHGVKLYVSDINQQAIEQAKEKYPDLTVVEPEDIFNVDVDVFAPCARGEVIKLKNMPEIKFKIMCGAANNQLQNVAAGEKLQNQGVVYCPDYVANLGGVCCIQYLEIEGDDPATTNQKIKATVRERLGLTFQTGFRNNLSFINSVDHVVKKIVWGKAMGGGNIENERLFPLTFHGEPHPPGHRDEV